MHIIKKLIAKIFDLIFIQPPKPGLKVLYYLKLDIVLYTLPLFIIDNLESLRKLRKLKKLKPGIIYTVDESDGRFNRFNEISKDNPEIVVFKYRPRNANVEEIYFKSYAAKPIGFYEDARQRYILPNNLKNRFRYRAYCHRVLNYLQQITGKIDYFCSGSNNDRWVVEMIAAAQEKGISWVVCEREGTSTDIGYEKEGEGFKISGSVVAHYHFLANDKHTKMFEDAKTPSVRMCKTIGELDTDWWFHYDETSIRQKFKKWDNYRKVILFLTFGERNYIEPTLFPDRHDISWKPLLIDCEEVLIEFAKKNPDILVIYRMGHKEDKNLQFLKTISSLGLTNIIQSDRATSSFSDVAIRSDLIIGFQSTAMYEAMFTNKPIIQVYWNILDFLKPETEILPISNFNACDVATSKENFMELLCKFSDNNLVPNEQQIQGRKKTRELMFANADGRMAERFTSELINLLSQKQKDTQNAHKNT